MAEITVYIPDEGSNDAGEILKRNIANLDPGVSYAEMMRHRINGGASRECKDVYYVCADGEELVCRLWMGWGKHNGAVGNWGNFFTDPKYRGQGFGRKMLDFWENDLKTRTGLPRALFCTAGDEGLTRLYEPYGFRPAMKGATSGPLYCPLGESPATFAEFCAEYYKSASTLYFKKATLEWRHEIDCLFKFAMLYEGLDYLPGGMVSLEASLLENGGEGIEIIFTDADIPVGLAKVCDEGKCDIRIHPAYLHLI